MPRKLSLSLALFLCSLAVFAQPPQHLFFRVTVGPKFTTPISGRMLIFLTAGTGAKQVDENPFAPTAVYVAAKDVSDLAAGAFVDVDTDDVAFPAGFSSLKPGDYQAQAVLDVNRNYNYSGRSAGDLVSDVVSLAPAADLCRRFVGVRIGSYRYHIGCCRYRRRRCGDDAPKRPAR